MKSDRSNAPLVPEAETQWRAWALAQGIASQHQGEAAAAAIEIGRSGAGAAACAAAARIAGGVGDGSHRALLRQELAFVEAMIAELGRPGLYPDVAPPALAAINSGLLARSVALRSAADRVFAPATAESELVASGQSVSGAELEVAPVASVATRPAKPPIPSRPPRPPLGPSLRQFASEHSILLLSYAGAFLLIVSVVLFELYGVASLGAPVRFAGVLGLDLVFAAAGWACLRSRRLRVVGHTYVAIAALQAPLVFVAAYVFFALQQKGISVDLALLITGAACTCLYAALALRLRSQAYGLLALIGLTVAWLGGVDLAAIGLWRGPVTGVLVAVYAAIAFWSSRIPAAGDFFARFAVPFVHGAAILAIALTAYDLRYPFGSDPTWIFTGLLASVGAGYLLYRLIGGTREGSFLAQGLLLLAWASLLSAAGAGSWKAALTVLPGAALAVLAYRRPRLAGLGEKLGREAALFMHAAVALGALLLLLDRALAELTLSAWLPWREVALAAAIAAVYLVAALAGAGRVSVGLAMAAAGLGWAAAAHDLALGDWTGPAVAAAVCLYPLTALAPVLGTRVGGLAARQARFHMWGATAIAIGFVVEIGDLDRVTGWPAAATLAVLTLGFAALALLADDLPAALTARAAFGLAWAVTAKSSFGGQWAGPATAALALVYAAPAHGRLRSAPLGRLASSRAEAYIYLAALAALGLSAGYARTTAELVGWPTAITFGLVAIALSVFVAFADGLAAAITARVAFGAAWILTVHDLGLGAWRGTADTLLVCLYALSGLPRLQLGRLGALLAARRSWLVHSSAAVALTLTAYDSLSLRGADWLFPATFAGLAVAYLLYAWLGGGLRGAYLGLGMAGLAWITAVFALQLSDWTAAAIAPLAIAYLALCARATGLGTTGALVARAAPPFIHAAVAIAVVLAVVLETADAVPPSDAWITWQAPVVLVIAAATYLGHWALFRRSLALFVMATAASLAVLGAGQVLQQGSTGAAIELVLLAAAWAAGVERSKDRVLQSLLRLGVGVQALLPLLVVAEPSWLAAALLLSATAVFAGMAEIDRSPRWLLAAGPTLAGAWYWAGATLFPGTPTTVENLALLFAPFPLALGIAGIVLRNTLGTRWALPAYLYSAIAVLGVEGLFLSVPAVAPAGRWLLADVVVLYAIAALERRHEAAIVAAVLAFAGIALTLAAAGAAPIWYPVALGAISVAVYAGQVPWERFYDRGSEWIAAHRYLGLGGAGMTAVSGFALFDYTRPGTLGCALAGLAVLTFAALVAVDGRRFGHPLWDYAAGFAASLATYFAARYFALANPEWYLAGPGLALVAIGLRMPLDSRLKPDHLLSQLAVAAGALLTLGVTASQAVVDPGWTQTVVLVVEGAASLVAGIGFRSRVLVVAGGAAIGVAALRSLFVLVQHGYLWVAFAAVALTLLGLGAAMALLRDRFQEARSTFAEQWQEWN